MRVDHAPNQLLFTDPHGFIRHKVMPIKWTCAECKTSLTLEMESDLYATLRPSGWKLAFDCMICGHTTIIPHVSRDEQLAERRTPGYEHNEEEYEELVKENREQREKLKNTYLEWGGDKYRLARDEYLKASTNFGFEKYIEDKYFPAEIPMVKPPVNILKANYDLVLRYYVRQARSSGPRKYVPLLPKYGEPAQIAAFLLVLITFISFFPLFGVAVGLTVFALTVLNIVIMGWALS